MKSGRRGGRGIMRSGRGRRRSMVKRVDEVRRAGRRGRRMEKEDYAADRRMKVRKRSEGVGMGVEEADA